MHHFGMQVLDYSFNASLHNNLNIKKYPASRKLVYQHFLWCVKLPFTAGFSVGEHSEMVPAHEVWNGTSWPVQSSETTTSLCTAVSRNSENNSGSDTRVFSTGTKIILFYFSSITIWFLFESQAVYKFSKKSSQATSALLV